MHASRNRLAPRRSDRMGAWLHPGWARSLVIRRGAAATLVIAAIAVTVTGRGDDNYDSVVIAAHDIVPGVTLGVSDVTIATIPRGIVPAGALRLSADVTGRTVTAPMRRGEMLTDSRLLSPRLPAQLLGRRDALLVPIRLADESVSSLLRPGDVVDVLGPGAEVLVRRAVVALDSNRPGTTLTRRDSTPIPVLLAMPEAAAHQVAAVGLDASVAVVVH
ncbi:MAG: SAF domain-containing protein [Gordonia sp. (in: high G+C Gram-positive bacteria)]